MRKERPKTLEMEGREQKGRATRSAEARISIEK